MKKLSSNFCNFLATSCEEFRTRLAEEHKGISKIEIEKFEIIENKALFYLKSKLPYQDDFFYNSTVKIISLKKQALTNVPMMTHPTLFL